MSLSDLDVKAKYSANGVTTAFAIPFAHISSDSTETKVYLVDESLDPPTETLQVESTDYALTGASPPGTPFDTHVTFNTAPASTYKVLIIRVLALTQPEDLDAVDTVNLATIERALDRVTAMVQELDEKIKRAPKFRKSNTVDTDPLLHDPEAAKYLRWNEDGDGIENVEALNSDVVSVTGSTDNALVRWDGTSGTSVQNGNIIQDDSGNLSEVGNIAFESTSVAIADSQSNTAITGMSIDGTADTSAYYLYELTRSTTLFRIGFIALMYKNGTWILEESLANGDDCGVEFDVNQTTTVGQVRYTSGAEGAGTLKFKRIGFNA